MYFSDILYWVKFVKETMSIVDKINNKVEE